MSLCFAIVDDNPDDCEKLKSCFSFLAAQIKEEFSVDEYLDSKRFLMHFDNQYNALFLDIEMPDINGLELAKQIRETDNSVMIIFVTNSAKYAASGYEVDAVDYILKPVDTNSFMLKMKRILPRIERRKDADILLKTDNGLERLQISHIKYIEVFGHYVIYHTYFGDYSIYGTLSAETKRLPDEQFVKCSRNCIVNLRYVESVKNGYCIVADEKLAISRPQKKAFIKALSDYMR